MAQRRHHYERAFDRYLKDRRLPAIRVDEARRALLPESVDLSYTPAPEPGESPRPHKLKSFDFVVYGERTNLIVEVKGRKIARRRPSARGGPPPLDAPISASDQLPVQPPGQPPVQAALRAPAPVAPGRLESWVTLEDIESLATWEALFGSGYAAVFVFLYWCDHEPQSALFQEVFEHEGRWYAVRAVTLADYRRHMVFRSAKWRTVHVPTRKFEAVSHPFAPPPGQPVDRVFRPAALESPAWEPEPAGARTLPA